MIIIESNYSGVLSKALRIGEKKNMRTKSTPSISIGEFFVPKLFVFWRKKIAATVVASAMRL